MLRRSAERPSDVQRILLGNDETPELEVLLERREVRAGGADPRTLSEREVEILRYLATRPGRAVSRDELLQRVWGLDTRGLTTRTIDMHVARLREKLGDDAANPRVVVTVRAKGYMLGEGVRAERA